MIKEENMTSLKLKQTRSEGDSHIKTTFKTDNIDHIDENLLKGLFGIHGTKASAVPIMTPPDVDHDIVAIYDNAGIPSIMRRFRKTTNKELFEGSDKTHPAFIIDGVEYDEIYISVYENCNINGKPYSLPYQPPWIRTTLHNAIDACASKGEGWHMLTAAEWGLLANTSLMLNTLPHGNTHYAHYHANETEHGEIDRSPNVRNNTITLTGSGPTTWTHDHTPKGVHDLCGNVSEMIHGLRISNGELQMIKDNDAAINSDITHWTPVQSGNVAINYTDKTRKHIWDHGLFDHNNEHLKELALFPGEPNTDCYVNHVNSDDADSDYYPIRGGDYSYNENASVFSIYFREQCALMTPSCHIGFRSAYFKKK